MKARNEKEKRKKYKNISRAAINISIGIAIVLSLAPTILYLFTDKLDNHEDYKIIILRLVLFSFIMLCLWAILLIYKYITAEINSSKKVSKITDSLHKQLTSVLRDSFVHITNMQFYHNSSQFNDYKIRTCSIFLKCLHDCIQSYSEQNVSVCVKLFVKDDKIETKNSKRVFTYCRWDSSEIFDIRKKHDLDYKNKIRYYMVEKNTPLKYINNGNEYFCCGDLRNYPNYENENELWKEYYNSTVVVPIYCSNTYSNQDFILGFLGIDSKDTCPFWEDDNNPIIKLTIIVADVLYSFLTLSDILVNNNKSRNVKNNDSVVIKL